jgi:hypothetical protein
MNEEVSSMSTAQQSIDVNVDVTTAYDQWAHFESFPRWMEGVARPERLADGLTRADAILLGGSAVFVTGLRRGVHLAVGPR